jgi:hypothetical protein
MAETLEGIFAWATNRQDYFHYRVGTTLYTDWTTSVLRNLLTTIFIVLGHLILWLGSYHLRKFNQRRLLRGWRVPISHLTSWLSLNDAASYFLHTFRLPGGCCFGWLMLITGALSLAHQYFVNSFIQQSNILDSCNFESGIVCLIPYTSPDGFTPSSTFSSATTIFNAQQNTYYNNGTYGIWRLVPFYAYYFSPNQDDLLGQWNCNFAGNITITSADWSSTQALGTFLVNNNLLNLNTGSITGSEINDITNGFLSWYSNYPDASGSWDTVSASMVFGLDGAGGTVSEWTCTLQTFGWTPTVFDSKAALTEWNNVTYGSLQDTIASEYGLGLELMLDAMFMAAAGGNIDTSKASLIPADVNSAYGCVIPGTQILVGIWVILAVYLATLIPLLIAFFISLFRSGLKYKKKDIIGDPPTSVYRWQTALVRVMTNNFDVKSRHLRKYYAASGIDGKLIVDTKDELNVL